MSSLDIAELTGKRHDYVLRDVAKMYAELGLPKNGGTSYYFDTQNKQRPCYNLDKILTITLVTGYNATMLHVIVNRWQELENNQ